MTWTEDYTSTECPTYWGWISWQYDTDVTRWVTFLKVPAEDCSLNLLQGMQPQIAFVVVQDCSTTVPLYDTEDNFTDLDLPDDEQDWTSGDLTRPTMDGNAQCTKRECKISKLRVWKNEETISGFEVVYDYP